MSRSPDQKTGTATPPTANKMNFDDLDVRCTLSLR
jgi:hypothetical protein